MMRYPEIYCAASEVSKTSQTTYNALIAFEYFFLIIASLLAMDWADTGLYNVVYAVVLISGACILLFRSTSKPEQRWYRSRALAESIKTTSWRYVSRAHPYQDAGSIQQPRGEFRNTLKLIMDGNKEALAASSASSEEEVTEAMDALRRLSLGERIEFYKKQRIEEQRKWYAGKWQINRRSGRRWIWISVSIYVCAIVCVLLRIAHPEWHKLPIEALIVLASSAIGWVQIKKFNELASAYSLTAQEIGIILSRVPEITTEASFSEFVNEAELAFSREHTQWVARLNEG